MCVCVHGWGKLATILDPLVSEYRVPFDGITQFLPRLLVCTPLRVSHQLVHIEQVECKMLLCGTWPPGMLGSLVGCPRHVPAVVPGEGGSMWCAGT